MVQSWILIQYTFFVKFSEYLLTVHYLKSSKTTLFQPISSRGHIPASHRIVELGQVRADGDVVNVIALAFHVHTLMSEGALKKDVYLFDLFQIKIYFNCSAYLFMYDLYIFFPLFMCSMVAQQAMLPFHGLKLELMSAWSFCACFSCVRVAIL